MDYSICLETFFPELDFMEKIERAGEAGFKKIEFWDHGSKNIKELVRFVKEGQVEISTFSGHRKGELFSDAGFKEYKDEIVQSIKIAKELKTPGLMILSQGLHPDGSALSVPSAGHSRETLLSRLFNNLLQLSRIAEQEKITLYLEPLNSKIDHPGIFLDSSRAAFKLVREIASPQLKVLYDIYHMQIMEGNIIDTLKENISYIGYIHIADVPGRHEPGTGELNYKHILKVLKDMNFSGTVGFELFPSKDSADVLAGIKSILV
ncbi:MAG: TIM barrel protein [Spirochaetes bacterium]|nr:TIM barrel protein [Spirochaetota bacterium]